jgi:hypothetical protein
LFGVNKTNNTYDVAEIEPVTMKEAIILKGPDVKIIDSPIPKAEKDQIVVKVIFSGSNPKDWVCKPLSRGHTRFTANHVLAESPVHEHRCQPRR